MKNQLSAKRVARGLGLTPSVVALETIEAYSDLVVDNHGLQRNLNWRASEPVSAEELVRIMSKVVQAYNEFDGIETTKRLVAMYPDAFFTIARQGSVCIFVSNCGSLNEQDIQECRYVLRADEVTFNDKELRIWWD